MKFHRQKARLRYKLTLHNKLEEVSRLLSDKSSRPDFYQAFHSTRPGLEEQVREDVDECIELVRKEKLREAVDHFLSNAGLALTTLTVFIDGLPLKEQSPSLLQGKKTVEDLISHIALLDLKLSLLEASKELARDDHSFQQWISIKDASPSISAYSTTLNSFISDVILIADKKGKTSFGFAVESEDKMEFASVKSEDILKWVAPTEEATHWMPMPILARITDQCSQ